MARVEDAAEAERLARHVNIVHGSWAAYVAAQPSRRWTRGANGLWRSVDPVIERQRERQRRREEEQRARAA